MFTRLADGNIPPFVDVSIEFLLSVTNVSWCWLMFCYMLLFFLWYFDVVEVWF